MHLNEDAEFVRSITANKDEDSVVKNATDSNAGGDVVQNIRGIGTNLDNNNAYSIVGGVLVCVLYAALPPEMQMLSFQPRPEGCTRKVILATNIAETSVTIEGIKYVVDAGKHKMREFNGVTGMESLVVADVSKVQVCFRYVVLVRYHYIDFFSFIRVLPRFASPSFTNRRLKELDAPVECHRDTVFDYTLKMPLGIWRMFLFQKYCVSIWHRLYCN